MGRLRWIPGSARREMLDFTVSRGIAWLEKGSWALGADYVIRALNTASRDPAALALGELVGRKLSMPELSDRCSAQLKRVSERRRAPVETLLGGSPHGTAAAQLCQVDAPAREVEQLTVLEKVSTSVAQERITPKLSGGTKIVEVFEDDAFGRGLRAVSRLPKGTAVLEDTAIFATRMNNNCCAHCLEKLPRVGDAMGVPCSLGCDESYCSEQCRDAAMEQYHVACCRAGNASYGAWQDGLVNQLANSGPDSRAALTCLAIGKICAAATVSQVHPLYLPGVDLLRGVTEFAPSDTLHHVGALTVSLGDALRQPHLFLEEFVSLYALMQTNEFLTADGTVLFAFLSLVNHSCTPNCIVVGPSATKKKLVTVKDVRENEQLTIDYNSSLTSNLAYEDRKALLAQRGFQCFCSKCILKK